MITAVVTFKIPAGASREQRVEQMKQTALRFQSVPGLIRKQFLYDEEKGLAGGVYLWETREAAEACYRGQWRDNVRKSSGGNEPEIAWFESPVVVDNETQKIKTAA